MESTGAPSAPTEAAAEDVSIGEQASAHRDNIDTRGIVNDDADITLVDDTLIEEISIDGMCGVY